MTSSHRASHRGVFSFASLALLSALLPWPYIYYQGLRLLVVGVCAYGVVLSRRVQRVAWGVTFAMVATPFIIVHAERSVWAIIDLAAAALIALGGRAVTRPTVGNDP